MRIDVSFCRRPEGAGQCTELCFLGRGSPRQRFRPSQLACVPFSGFSHWKAKISWLREAGSVKKKTPFRTGREPRSSRVRSVPGLSSTSTGGIFRASPGGFSPYSRYLFLRGAQVPGVAFPRDCGGAILPGDP